jgi:8-oxo-dGTP pyrophosphatase MutT (NUDIX family)
MSNCDFCGRREDYTDQYGVWWNSVLKTAREGVGQASGNEVRACACWDCKIKMKSESMEMLPPLKIKKYVLIYAHDCCESFIIVKKDRPKWQYNLFNLIGGSIEEGETPQQAAVRELEEETGLKPISEPEILGTINSQLHIIGPSDVIVYCVKLSVSTAKIKPRSEETEVPMFVTYREIKDDPELIKNLKVIIPLMQCGLSGWKVEDCYANQSKFNVTVM